MKRDVLIAAAVCGAILVLIGFTQFAPVPSQGIQQTAGPDCAIAPVDPDTAFVAATVFEGDTLSNVQLGDPKGTTTIVRVHIASDAKPVTVLLQAGSDVIWDFEGAVDRVARAMIVADGNRGAVRGLPHGRIDFPKLTRCPVRSIPLADDARETEQQRGSRNQILKTLFGRAPEQSAYFRKVNSVTLPGVRFGFAPRGPEGSAEPDAERRLLGLHPGGFRIVDAKSLYSQAEVLVPETLPGDAGLLQLEHAGAIRPARREEIESFTEGFSKPYRSKLSPDFRMSVEFHYAVTRDIRLPARLYAANRRHFLVLAGVPVPRGDPGHGCVGYMDGFKVMDDGPVCYGSGGADAVRQLSRLPEDFPASCRLLDLSDDTSVEAVSIYEPKGANHSFRSTRIPVPVDVRVSKPGAVTLALNAHEPAIWRVSSHEDTRIAAVILTGAYPSSVEGIAPGTPVVRLDPDGRKARPPADFACLPLYNYLGIASRGGPAAMLFDRQISAVTGKGIDGLRGDYALGSVEIR